MEILFLSDTHGQHRRLKDLPEADMLIHAGDITQSGEDHEVEDFIRWLCQLGYHYKIFIGGNHDFYLESESVERIQRLLPDGTFYLCDSGVTINGIRIWGSPVTPVFYNWAFNHERGKEIRKHWRLIPSDTDILVTHGPPFGVLDTTKTDIHAGCEDLLKFVNRIRPAYHLFGHIHEAYGLLADKPTIFANGSIMDENFRIVHPPIVINIP